MNCRLADLRHHLHFLCLMAAPNSAMDLPRPVWTTFRTIAEQSVDGHPLHLGWTLFTYQGTAAWKCTDPTRRYSKEFHLQKEFAYKCLQRDNCVAIRAGHGLTTLPALQGHTSSSMLWWFPGRESEPYHYEYDCIGSLNLRQFMPEQWKSIRLVQFLCTDPTAPHAETSTRAIAANEERDQPLVPPDGRLPANVRQPPSDHSGRLSTIPEERSEADESQASDPTEEFFVQEDPDLRNALHKANLACMV